jgi:glycosyltransferase involved in cell wall biosynthesis
VAPFVALVAHPSADLYGSDRVLLESVEGLLSGGAQVVVTLPSDGPLAAKLTASGASVRLCTTPVLRKNLLSPRGIGRLLWGSLQGLLASFRLVSAVRPDVIYVNTLTIPLWNLVGLIRGIPVLVHVHEAEGSASLLMRRLLAFPLLVAGSIVANSKYSSGVLEGAFTRLKSKTTVVYNGVSGPERVQRPRDALDGPVRILFVGRLSPRKGVDVVVESMALLRERGVSAELDLVGAVFPGYEWFEDQLRDLVRVNKLGSCVRFHGFQPTVWDFLAAADVAVVPSRLDEPFGNTVVEALLAARPVVISETSGLVEAGSGYSSVQFVAPGSAEAIADAVQAVAGNWNKFRTAALEDAVIAAERHGILRYRTRMAREIRIAARKD